MLNSDFNGDITSAPAALSAPSPLTAAPSAPATPSPSTTVTSAQLTFVGGDLLGDVLVDGSIGGIDMLVDAFGFKSQIGIASWRHAASAPPPAIPSATNSPRMSSARPA